MTSLLPLLLYLSSSALDESRLPEVLERRAVDARTAVRTLTATVVRTGPGVQVKGISKDASAQVKVWVDGDRVRADVVRPDSGYPPKTRVVECRNCGSSGQGIVYVDARPYTSSVFKIGRAGSRPLDYACNWRNIGYYQHELVISGRHSISAIFTTSDRGPVSVVREPYQHSECWVLRWKQRDGTRRECWIDPARGNNVVRFRAVNDVDGRDFTSEVTSDVQPVAESGIWFPSRVRFEQRSKGQLGDHETLELSDVRANEPIPPEVFTLSGFGVREGAPFASPDGSASGVWSNGKLGPFTPPRRAPTPSRRCRLARRPTGGSTRGWPGRAS